MIKFNLAALIILFFTQLSEAQNANQKISANIDVLSSSLEIINQITLPKTYLASENSGIFYLNKNLIIESVIGGEVIELINTDNYSITYAKKYEIKLNKPELNLFTITYKGIIKDDIKQSAAEYARGFSETKGIIFENGIYLAGSTYWLPKFENDLLSTFDLEVEIDKDWSIVSQGKRIKNIVQNGKKNIVYSSPEPMDEVYLIGAKWTEYSKKLGNVEVQAFLRTPDQELADRYLNTTSGYLQMYNTLIGDYPYTKFALVENFWETGYGMPSFTLLGEKVIRFPWILYSSYPHELLHNYWGNGVFVDYSKGNWCEGITAYMSDHLMQEQRGSGAVYRRNTLQKFTDYVNEENDIPINKFISRNNSAEEAIGYGKVLMMNNMLRNDLGDETFIKAYQEFYNDNKFTKASFTDIQKSFEKISGKDLSVFFTQWIDRTGAPSLEVSNVKSENHVKNYQLSFTLKQTQKEEVFNIKIPIAIYTSNNDVIWKNVNMDTKVKSLSITLEQEPLKIEIDPQFNIMRRLDRKETPSSLSQVFGAKKSVIILPSSSKHLLAYKELAETWKATQEAQGKVAAIVMDVALDKIPNNQSVWIIGNDNKFNTNSLQTSYASALDMKTKNLINKISTNGSLVYAIPNQNNLAQSVGFVGSNSDKAINALTSKLLHYGKYGYLGFEGDEAKNVLKGSLPALNSPLSIRINEGEITAKMIPRKALYQN